MASATGTPVLASLSSTSSSAPRLSGALPGSTSTAVISWESVSTTIAALCPSNRRLLLLWPWRISGSCTDSIRSRLTPSLRLTPSSARSTSWSSNWPSSSAAATIRCRSSLSSGNSPCACRDNSNSRSRISHNPSQQRRPRLPVGPVDGRLALHAGAQVSLISPGLGQFADRSLLHRRQRPQQFDDPVGQ